MSEMLQIDIKSLLLELLQDEEIRLQVLKIVESKFIKENNEKLNDKYNELVSKIERLENENLNKERELEDTQKKLDDIEKKLKYADRQIEQYKNAIQQHISNENQLKRKLQPVDEMLDLWERVLCLPEIHRRYFDELSGGDNMIAYFSIGRDIAKLKQMQKYIQEVAVEDTEDEITYSTLNNLLCFCVDVANFSKDPSEKLEKLHIDTEGEFDFNMCVKTSSSKNKGHVSHVLLQGFCNQEGRVIFRNVVRLS